MTKWSPKRILGVAGLVAVGLAAVVSAQAPTSSPYEQLLAEVRGLRSELSHAASTSIRTQLLVARLQLQEQRINTLVRQLTEVQGQLAGLGPGLAMITGQMKEAEENRQEPDKTAGAMVEQMQKREQELRNQEASLSALMASEQLRWIEFNDRLDELERALPARVPRR